MTWFAGNLRFVVGMCCPLVLAACATDPGASDEVTDVVTDRVVVTEDADTTTPSAGDGQDAAHESGAGGGDTQPFPADTARDEAPASGAQLTLTDVRVGTHVGYDRVTFEFSGDGEPGWVVRYTEEARAQGSGAVVDVAGDATLQVLITSVAPPTGDEVFTAPGRIASSQLEVIDEVVPGTTFEGALDAFIGVTEQVPFRARRFSAPPRVVIDIMHPGTTG